MAFLEDRENRPRNRRRLPPRDIGDHLPPPGSLVRHGSVLSNHNHADQPALHGGAPSAGPSRGESPHNQQQYPPPQPNFSNPPAHSGTPFPTGGGGPSAMQVAQIPPMQMQQLYLAADAMAHAIVSGRRRIVVEPLPLDSLFPPIGKASPRTFPSDMYSGQHQPRRGIAGGGVYCGATADSTTVDDMSQDVQQQLDALDAWIRGNRKQGR